MDWIAIALIALFSVSVIGNLWQKRKMEVVLGRKIGTKEYMKDFNVLKREVAEKSPQVKTSAVPANKAKEHVTDFNVPKREVAEKSPAVPIEKIFTVNIIKQDEKYPPFTPEEIIEAYERKRFDVMRGELQKIAYGMVGDHASDEEKQAFKKVMTFFAALDPLYRELMEKLYPIILRNEGILQSKIYPYLPGYSQEDIRYVLYFAHELEDIERRKKGRSYELYRQQGQEKSLPHKV